jgi:hypothetical protein
MMEDQRSVASTSLGRAFADVAVVGAVVVEVVF